MTKDGFRQVCYQIELDSPGLHIETPIHEHAVIEFEGPIHLGQLEKLVAAWNEWHDSIGSDPES